MRLHENLTLFRQSVEFASQKLDIPQIYIEKDYWVTYALHLIFHNEIGEETVFKGGTALSKCFGIIERFSEDIDLVVLRKDGESANQLKNKLKKVTDVVSKQLEVVEIEGVTKKLGMIRKIAFNYKQEFKGVFGQVRDVLIVESTWLGRYEPYHKHEIASYIYDMMRAADQLELAKEYGMLPFEVNVLHVNRTICEKIMSLVRFSYGEDPLYDLKKKIRHTYDIHQLLQVPEIKGFFESSDFERMLLLVAKDDTESFKSNNEWLAHHPKEALIFSQTEEIWKELENTYTDEFGNLVHGILPAGTDVLDSLKLVSERLKNVNWS
ncbi:MAG: nucleotidyl transferase AbiEii/AbiGii toxin family protein [Salibacteraceae bacterium]|nr:nucleotidyl transferase AbiEii/AbiGii toxin family protein [Salibacteraceae bacterium]